MPNDYDRIIKENIEPLQMPLLRKLFGFDPPRLLPLEAKLQVTLEREMDNIKRVAHDDPSLDYGLQTEFHVTDEDLRARNFLHYGMFYHKYRMALRQIVIYLGNTEPTRITNNILDIRGGRLEFEVVVLKKINKEIFLHSQVPEEVMLAILCDFGQDKPAQVVRQILQHIQKIVKRPEHLMKYQKQLVVLSRLRKLETITKMEVAAMTIHYDIEQDGLYLEGLEKGIEKGIEKQRHESVKNLLKLGKLSIGEIAVVSAVTVEYVKKIQKELESESKRDN